MVGRSSYPFLVSVSMLGLTTSGVVYLKYGVFFGLVISIISLALTAYFWWDTVIMEALAGNHSYHLMEALKFSFMLFIFSEFMFFFSIFWVFFDSALSPSMDLGEEWSPLGVNPINPYGIPLFNTVVLLSSGATVTWSHNNLLSKVSATLPLLLTVLLATVFEVAQYFEYSEATFSISDGIFGSVFYFGTGFHGMHVLLGHAFLTVNLVRLYNMHFSRSHHLSLEFAIVYWHFVDVVWLFLYVFVYWWSY